MNKLQEPVLVVDDEADIRDLMEMTLMKMGLRVDTAAGVEEAKDRLDNNDYSLVLTDMRMPDGSGLEVVQYIDELMLDTPVAVITAFGNADQAVEALKAGAFDYLQNRLRCRSCVHWSNRQYRFQTILPNPRRLKKSNRSLRLFLPHCINPNLSRPSLSLRLPRAYRANLTGL